VLCHLLVSDAAGALVEVQRAVADGDPTDRIEHLLTQALRAVARARTSFETSLPSQPLINRLDHIATTLSTIESRVSPTVTSEAPTVVMDSASSVESDEYPDDDDGTATDEDFAIGRAALEADQAREDAEAVLAEAATVTIDRVPSVAADMSVDNPPPDTIGDANAPAPVFRSRSRSFLSRRGFDPTVPVPSPPRQTTDSEIDLARFRTAQAAARLFYGEVSPTTKLMARESQPPQMQESRPVVTLPRIDSTASRMKTAARAAQAIGSSVRNLAFAALALLGIGVGSGALSREPGPIIDAVDMSGVDLDEAQDVFQDQSSKSVDVSELPTEPILPAATAPVQPTTPPVVTPTPSRLTPPIAKPTPPHKRRIIGPTLDE
jgi:hypothetical protein